MRALILLFLFLLLLAARLHAQDDPNYISANVPATYYNPAAVPFSKRGEIAAVFRNQSGTERFNGQAGIFSATCKTKKDRHSGGLLYEADKGVFQSLHRLNVSYAPRVCRIKESEIRLGLRFGLSQHYFNSNKFLDVMQDTLYPHDAVPEIRRRTICIHPGVFWQNKFSSISFACKILPSIMSIYGKKDDPASLQFVSRPSSFHLSGQITHAVPMGSAGLLRVNLAGQNTRYQHIYFLYFNNVITNTRAVDYYFRQYRNGKSDFFLAANIDYDWEKYSIGVMARGFDSDINNIGLKAGLNWFENGRFWIAVQAPRKNIGFVCETGLSYKFDGKKPAQKPIYNSDPLW